MMRRLVALASLLLTIPALCLAQSQGGYPPQSITSTDKGGAIATGNTWQEWFPPPGSNGRLACELQNTSATEILSIAIQTTTHPAFLGPGGVYDCGTSGRVEQQHIYITAATSGHPFAGWGQ